MKKNKITIAFLILFFLGLIFSCSMPEISNLPTKKNAGGYKGEDLFTGIYFERGEVAGAISEVFTNKPNLYDLIKTDNEKTQVLKIQQNILKLIKTNDPAFFDLFASQIQSGDFLKVSNALDYGFSTLQKNIMLLPEIVDFAKEIKTNKALSKKVELFKNLDLNNFIINKKFDRDKLDKHIEKELSKLPIEENFTNPKAKVGTIICLNFFACATGAVYNVYLAVNLAVAVNVAVASILTVAINVNVTSEKTSGTVKTSGTSGSTHGCGGEYRIGNGTALEHELMVATIAKNLFRI